jgi:hypothetical protein
MREVVTYDLNHTENKLVQWGHDTCIVEQGTVWAQTIKMGEEFVELVAAQCPDKSPTEIVEIVQGMLLALLARGRIKPVAPENAVAEQIDAVCDMHVVGTQILSMLGTSRSTELYPVYEVLNKRTAGGRMINGTFVKAKDLPENQGE